MLFVTSSVCVTSCHTQLIIHKPYQAGKPGFAGRDRPKPLEAWKTGSGFEFDRPEASKSWATEPAFRPSRAGKSLRLAQLDPVEWERPSMVRVSLNDDTSLALYNMAR